MLRYFVPVWSGDFRLERESDATCRLTVENPTAPELEQLRTFLRHARTAGWVDEFAGVAPTGKSALPISASLQDAGPILATAAYGDAATWTAVRSAKGNVVVVTGHGTAELKRAATKIEEAADNLATTAAVVVREVTRGCPLPESAPRRASEVLRAFSTRSQWETWEASGRMKVIGNATGRAYWLHHRDEAARRGLDRVLTDAVNGEAVCAWDSRVPSEEEALAIKLAVEHREKWLLRFGTVMGAPGYDRQPPLLRDERYRHRRLS